MKPYRALGMRFFDPPRPELSEREADDITSFTSRGVDADPDALTVMPPQRHWPALPGPVRGRELQGTLPDDPYARFVLRLPDEWNGRLVVSAAPGLVSERGCDLYWSDYCLGKGCAFACTDKGVRMFAGQEQGFVPLAPEGGISRWFGRLRALALLAKDKAAGRYGRKPDRLYAVGNSNGGYLARRAVEEAPDLFDGAVDVSGVLWRAEGPNLLEQLPAALRASAGDRLDRAALESLGFRLPRDWEPLIRYYRSPFWELVLMYFIGTFDPDYIGEIEDYDLSERPGAVRERIARIENTGKLGSPLVTVFGAADPMLAPGVHDEAYAELVRSQGQGELHRVHSVERGSHNDLDIAQFPQVETLLPYARRAFDELVEWVERKPAAGRPAS